MSYQISDTGAGIKFTNSGKEFLVLKAAVKHIFVKGDIIQINTGTCSGSITIKYTDVSSPVVAHPISLANFLNNMFFPEQNENP